MTRARGANRPRFRLLPTVLLTLAILAVPTAVYAWGRSSSSFDITTVRVEGTHLLPAKKTLRLLRKTYAGDNLFTVTADDVRKTLAPQAFVAAVTVDRAFPHTLEVGITERVPAAYALAGTRWYVVDEGGFVVCTAADAAAQLGGAGKAVSRSSKAGASASPDPSASPSPGATPEAGQTASTDDIAQDTASGDAATTDTGDAEAGGSGGLGARLAAGPASAVLPLPRIAVEGRVRVGAVLDAAATTQKLALIAALPGSYRRELAAVEDKDGQLTLRFEDGLVATWGDATRMLAKTVALRTVLAEYEHAGKTCTEIDVSIPDRTLAKPVLH